MDKDLKKKVKELGTIERAHDSEDWRKSEDLAKAVIMNENYEDSLESIRSLKKKLKVNRGILITGIVVFLILLLYVIYTAFNKPVPVQPAVKEPEPEIVTQHIINKNLVFALDVPNVSVDSYKLGDLLDGYEENENAIKIIPEIFKMSTDELKLKGFLDNEYAEDDYVDLEYYFFAIQRACDLILHYVEEYNLKSKSNKEYIKPEDCRLVMWGC